MKGSQLKKSNTHADLFYHFQDVWNVQNNHMVKGRPQNYIFYLMCSYQPQLGCVTGYQVIRVIRIFAKTYPFE